MANILRPWMKKALQIITTEVWQREVVDKEEDEATPIQQVVNNARLNAG